MLSIVACPAAVANWWPWVSRVARGRLVQIVRSFSTYGCSLITAFATAAAVCGSGSVASATDAGRVAVGDTVVIAVGATSLYEQPAVVVEIPQGTHARVVELAGPWIGVSLTVQGKQRVGWVRSHKVFKRDEPGSIDALRKVPKVRVEVDYLGNAWRMDGKESAITGGGLSHVRGLYELQGVELSRTPVADGDLSQLAGLTNLRWVYLDRTSVGDEGLKHLAGMTNLEVLVLSDTGVTGTGFIHLRGLQKLRVLNVAGCKLRDNTLRDFRYLRQLETVALDSATIGAEAINYLKGMPHLNVLNLRNTKLPPGTLLTLRECHELRIIYVGGANVEDSEKKALKKLLPNVAILD